MREILGAAIGNCVHVGGVMNFLKLAEGEGYSTEFLGAAVPVKDLIKIVLDKRPDIVGISYRLTPAAVKPLLEEVSEAIEKYELQGIKWLFGGTEPVARVAEAYPFFERIFDGTEEIDDTISFLRGRESSQSGESYPDNLIDRINAKYPYPVLRHHFGLPSLKETIEGIGVIAAAKILDVISIAPDQNAQSYFFHPENMDRSLDGAGGVPARTFDDFKRMYDASQTGNHPLLRCYSGTGEVFRFAEMLQGTINNAWAAIPLCWYNVLDGRGTREVAPSIAESQELMRWHGERGIPVEVNEAHHWSLRDAHDAIGVAAAYLAAYNAKKMGVKDYVSQYMFNVPPSISPKMDLAKMLAKIELIESLEDEGFKTYRQVRAGLASLPTDLYAAKGQLAASTYLAMTIKPHIIHVVGYCEAHHEAKPEDIIESCRIVRGVIRNTMQGLPDMAGDSEVQERKAELIKEAGCILDAIKTISKGAEDPLTNPGTISRAIKIGILDAPHLRGNSSACGKLETRIVNGACYAYDSSKGRALSERERIDEVLSQYYSGAAGY